MKQKLLSILMLLVVSLGVVAKAGTYVPVTAAISESNTYWDYGYVAFTMDPFLKYTNETTSCTIYKDGEAFAVATKEAEQIYSQGQNLMVIDSSDLVNLADGVYKFEFPQGAFSNNDATEFNMAFSFEVTIGDASTDDPTGGLIATVCDFMYDPCGETVMGGRYGMFAFTLNDAQYTLPSSSAVVEIAKNGDAYQKLVNGEENNMLGYEDGIYTVMFAPALQGAGEYVFTFPEGAYTSANGKLKSPEFKITITIEGLTPEVYTEYEGGGYDPTGAYSMGMGQFYWRFVDNNNYTKLGENPTCTVTLDGEDYVTLINGLNDDDPADDANSIFSAYYDDEQECMVYGIGYYPPLTKEGTYVFTFPKGTYVTEDGDLSPEFTIEIVVADLYAQTYTVVPENETIISTKEGLSAFSLSYTNYRLGKTPEDAAAVKMTISKDGTEVVTVSQENVMAGWYGPGFNIYVPEDDQAKLKEAGEYTVVIPEGFYYLQSNFDETKVVANEAITLKYTLVAPPAPLELVSTVPAAGTVTSLKEVVFTFNKEVELGDNPFMQIKSGAGKSVKWATFTQGDDKKVITLTVDDDETINTPGFYNISIPTYTDLFAGVDGSELDEESPINLTYVIEGAVDYKVTPAADAKVHSISSIVVEFPTMYSAAEVDGKFAATLKKGEKSYDLTLVKTTNYDYQYGARVYLATAETLIEDGEYTLEVAAGAFNLGANPQFTETTMASPAVSSTITIADGYAIEVNPAAGAVVASIDSFVVTITGAKSVTLDAEKVAKLNVYQEYLVYTGMEKVVADYEATMATEGNVTTVTFTIKDAEAFKTAVDALDAAKTYFYKFNVPAGLIVINGEAYAGYNNQFTWLKDYVAPEYTVDPASGSVVETLEKITLTVTKGAMATEATAVTVLLNGAAQTATTATITKDETLDKYYIVLAPAVSAAGEWTVVLEGLFTDALGAVETSNLVYTIKEKPVSGIDNLAAEGGLFTVYNVAGQCLVNGGNAEAVKALAPGLYIINGKKVVLK